MAREPRGLNETWVSACWDRPELRAPDTPMGKLMMLGKIESRDSAPLSHEEAQQEPSAYKH